VYLKEFLNQRHGRHNQTRLRKRRQGMNEPAMEYYYNIMNLCRLVDLEMSLEARVNEAWQ
jgi:hypothetical protein